MSRTEQKNKKRKEKAKALQKERERQRTALRQRDQAEFFLSEANWYFHNGDFDKALAQVDKALRYKPGDADALRLQAMASFRSGQVEVGLKAMLALHAAGRLEDQGIIDLGFLLVEHGKFAKAVEVIDYLLARLPTMAIRAKKKLRTDFEKERAYCLQRLHWEDMQKRAMEADRIIKAAKQAGGSVVAKQGRQKGQMPLTSKIDQPPPPASASTPPAQPPPTPLPEISVSFTLESDVLAGLAVAGRLASIAEYEVALAAHRIRSQEAFDTLLCLAQLSRIRSLWYQEETAKKVLKSLRGRALLADEVGLGKTIEALIVLKEYMQRGMVKNALILTPAPLVSQWRDELAAKFDLSFCSTDDADFRARGEAFWQQPFILASINVAKSQTNFERVASREYDLVIVDEAHHLKNRTTLNWKLVNALKKRFLLLLTATPVENDLMELYSIITLLKPGQLKTAAAFRSEFMTSGDPTDPRNREKLRELLGQVMIRNTRAVARLGLPPRFAETLRVEPTDAEKLLYTRIDGLVRLMGAGTPAPSARLLLKNLLAAAGSSPAAVAATLANLLAKKDMPAEQQEEVRAINTLCRSLEESAKNRRLLELIRKGPDKIIIFVKFMATVEYISDFLAWHKIPHALFHGGLTNRDKDEQLRIFAEERQVLITTEVGGEGRNLQFCHRMVNYDLPWNPMKIEQRIGRLHRLGQEHEVLIHNLCAAGSMEDYILYVLDRKINMFELVIGEIDMIVGRIRGEADFEDLAFDIWLAAASAEQRQQGFDELAVRLKRLKASYLKTKALDEKLFGENYES